MANTTKTNQLPISPDLLEILRDPQAIQDSPKYGPDPGKLTLEKDSWLVSADTGYKYPIRDGIPVMLIEEGAKWKDTPVEALPVPPPPADPVPVSTSSERPASTSETGTSPYVIWLSLAAVLTIALVLISLGRRRSTALTEPAGDSSLPS
jgi:uncharacterized protein YbaR (Trm112 family)